MRKFFEMHWAALHTIQIFINDVRHLNQFGSLWSSGILAPTTLIFTRRHSGWSWWEVDDHRSVIPHKLAHLLQGPRGCKLPKSARKVVLEYEIEEGDKAELEEVMEASLYHVGRCWQRMDGKALYVRGDEEPMKWVRERELDGFDKQGQRVRYVVKVITWEDSEGA